MIIAKKHYDEKIMIKEINKKIRKANKDLFRNAFDISYANKSWTLTNDSNFIIVSLINDKIKIKRNRSVFSKWSTDCLLKVFNDKPCVIHTEIDSKSDAPHKDSYLGVLISYLAKSSKNHIDFQRLLDIQLKYTPKCFKKFCNISFIKYLAGYGKPCGPYYDETFVKYGYYG